MSERLTAVRRKSLYIWGAGKYADVVAEAVKVMGIYEIVGFLDTLNPHRSEQLYHELPIYESLMACEAYEASAAHCIALGFGDCRGRLEALSALETSTLRLVNIIHPFSNIPDGVDLGLGIFVDAGAVIGTGAVLGDGVLVGCSACICHHCTIGRAAHIAPNATLCGSVSIGQASFVGAGAVVRDGVSIGDNVVIGAGAVVVSDIPDNVVAYGCPARIVNKQRP